MSDSKRYPNARLDRILEWIEILETPIKDGGPRQCRGQLHSPLHGGFCCLGVMQDHYAECTGDFNWKSHNGMVSFSARVWYGLPGVTGSIYLDGTCAVHRNDVSGESFLEIAAAARREFGLEKA